MEEATWEAFIENEERTETAIVRVTAWNITEAIDKAETINTGWSVRGLMRLTS